MPSKERRHHGNQIPINHHPPAGTPAVSSRLLASPLCDKSLSNDLKSTSLDSFDVKEILEEENAKKLIQTGAASCLYSLSLQCGNIVSIPTLSGVCILHVKGAEISNQDLTDEMHHSSYPQALNAMHH
ncbi:hypothetical protein SLE2022_060980 [Rubroshorea leprosula]